MELAGRRTYTVDGKEWRQSEQLQHLSRYGVRLLFCCQLRHIYEVRGIDFSHKCQNMKLYAVGKDFQGGFNKEKASNFGSCLSCD